MASSAIESIPSLYRLSVAQYHAMRDAGVLGEDDRVELLEGLLVPQMTKKPPHRLATGLVREAIEKVLPPRFYVDSQEPITTDDSEPEPDVVVVRGARRDYAERHPGPRDVPLVIEIADDSLARDRGAKLRGYARARIPVYWIVRLRTRSIEVYSSPESSDYAKRDEYGAGSEVPVVIDGVEVLRLAVDTLLP